MNPYQLGQLPNVPTKNELWKNEPNKYRHWIILLVISLISVVAFGITAITLIYVNKSEYVKNIVSYFQSGRNSLTISEAERYLFWQMVLMPIIIISLLLIGFVFFVKSLFITYKTKDFSKLSNFVLTFGFFVGLLSLMDIIWLSIRGRLYFMNTGFTFLFLITPLSIFYGFTSFKVSSIRRIFLISDRIEKIKNDPNFQKMQEMMKNNPNGFPNQNMYNPMQGNQNMNTTNNGAFGPVPVGSNSQSPNQSPNQAQNIEIPLTQEQKDRKELSELTLSQLKEIAKKLSISGYEKMKRKEITDIIIRIKLSEDKK
ncbi:MAG: Rho termination factor N-terminal domain-containing protein [Mycoplasma sp.]|nr:Rho termination factor N-terminal domain-containing protein [Mycoplasma sp.]